MKKFFLIPFLIMCTVLLYSEELQFRGLSFGSSIEEVMDQEGEPYSTSRIYPIIEGGTDVVYMNKMVASYNSVLSFMFDSREKLVWGGYFITVNPELSNPQKETYNKNAYHDLISKLKSLYGEPIHSTNPPSNYDPNDQCETLWIYEGCGIKLSLSLVDGYMLSLDYLSKQLTEKWYGTDESIYGL